MLGRAVRDPGVARAIWFVSLPALLFGTLTVLAPLRLSELGVGAVAIASVYLVSAGLEALASPVLGRLSDQIGRWRPIRAGLLASALVAAALPWPVHAAMLAALVICAGLAFGSFWPPAMSLLADEAEALGLDYAYAFALINLAWAIGQASGSSGGGALAEVTADAIPYLLLSATCLATFAALVRGQVTQPSLNE
jgi:MFS family permease